MKDVRLLQLRLDHFKGVDRNTLRFDGHDAAIYGPNASGKTTIADSWFWLITGKDSLGRSDFAIQTIRGDEPIHNTQHSVEAVVACEGQEYTLRRTYAEKWTKRRNAPQAELTGHTTSYFVDGVPYSERDYNTRVAEIIGCDAKTFALLTSHTAFDDLHWQDRRRLLIDVCGDVSNADVIASKSELADLPAILGKRTVDDHRKVVTARRREVNAELDRIPVRIDEAARALPSANPPGALKTEEVDALAAQIKQLREERTIVQQGAGVPEAHARLHEIELDLWARQREATTANAKRVEGAYAELNAARAQLNDVKAELDRLHSTEARCADAIQQDENELNALRRRWTDVAGEEYTERPGDDVCPACGQSLPADQVEAAREKAVGAFNRSKSERLTEIVSSAERVREASSKHADALAKAKQSIILAGESYDKTAREVERLESELNAIQQQPAPDPDDGMKALQEEQHQLRERIDHAREDASGEVECIDQKIAALTDQLDGARDAQATLKARESGLRRMAELHDEKKALSREMDRLERELYLCELFVRTKVDMLTERINGHFMLARFTLFEEQVNGGLREVAETTVDGVPYGSGLNHGARVLVGLDILHTLQGHFGVRLPVVVDNAESMTVEIESPAQLITLVASDFPGLSVRVAGQVAQ